MERQIAKITGEEKRGCALCGCNDSLEHVVLFSAHAQITWMVALRVIKFKTGIDLKLNPSMIFLGLLGGSITNVCHKRLVGRVIIQSAYFIFHTYYSRAELMSSWEITKELVRRYYYKEDTPRKWSPLDPLINSGALVAHISSLKESEIKEGLGNMAIWLRGPNGKYREPELVLEEGFCSCIRENKEPTGKIINWEMLRL